MRELAEIDWERIIRADIIYRYGLFCVALAGALALFALRPPSGEVDLLLTLIVGALVAAGRSVNFRVSAAGSTHMGTPALLACVLLLQPSVAVLTVAVATALSDGVIRRGSRGTAFNTGQVIVQAFIVLGVLHLVGWNPAEPTFGDPETLVAIFIGGMLAITSSALMVSISASFTQQNGLLALFWEILMGGDAKLYLIDLSKICFGLVAAMLLTWTPVHVLLIVIPVATMSQAIARGITFQTRLEKALHETEHSLAEAQRLAQLGSWEWELSGRYMRWSDQTFEITGVTSSSSSVSLANLRKLLRKSDRRKLEQIIGQLVETHGTAAFDHEIFREDGSVRFVHHVLAWAPADERAGDRLVGTLMDITDRKRLELELRHQAYHDGLTGLPNRELFLERLIDCLTMGRGTGRTMAVIFLDLDYFKTINDRFGHEAGDCVLIEIARRLEQQISPEDTAARLSGDEFTVLAFESEEGRIEALAERLLSALQRPVMAGGQMIPLSASAGLVYIDDHHQTPSDVLREADSALYRAKGSGRGRICVEAAAAEPAGPTVLRDLA